MAGRTSLLLSIGNVMQLFVPQHAQSAVVVMLLQALPNWDWRKARCVEFYKDIGPPELRHCSREECAGALADGVLAALCHSQFHVYPRHRWTGADVAVSELGLISMVHGLLDHTLTYLCDSIRGCNREHEHR